MMWLMVVVSLVFTTDEGPKVSLLLASSYEECSSWSKIANSGGLDLDRSRRHFFCYRITQ